MSSTAKKPKNPSGPALIPNAKSPHLSLAASSEKDDCAMCAVFTDLAGALRGLLPECDFFIGRSIPFERDCRVEIVSGAFTKLKGQLLNTASEHFQQLLSNAAETVVVDSQTLRASDSAFSEIGDGEAIFLRADLSGDEIAVVCCFHPNSQEKFAPEKIKALRTLISIAGRATAAEDLALDIQAQQLHLDTMTVENEEIQYFYRHFSEAVRQCFWILDIDAGKTLVVSDNFEIVWGTNRKILNEGAAGFADRVFPADRDRALSEFHTRLESDLDIELRVIADDGEVRWIWLRSFPIAPERSHPDARRVVLIADDITDKKIFEESARERQAEAVLRARTLAMSDLANGVAHEINNPLAIIVGKAHEIKRAVSRPVVDIKSIETLAEKIQQTSVRIAEIVTSLKSLSISDREGALSPWSLARVIHDVTDMCSERFKSGEVRFEMAPVPESLVIEMNPTMISQMLLNLLHNAFDAVMDERDKWVKFEFAEDTDSVFLFVTDSGPGIPIKNRGRIFDPFFTTKGPGQSTGLGLSMAASIAAHHGGTIRLDTMSPHTRFVAQIPKTVRHPDDH